MALWENFIKYYNDAYALAIENSVARTNKAMFDGGGCFYNMALYFFQDFITILLMVLNLLLNIWSFLN